MEIKLFNSQKHVFWEALLVTIVIFAIGVIAGFVLENWRTAKIDTLYKNSEVNLLDVQIQSQIYGENYFDCNSAINENIKFADNVYKEADLLDRYQKASLLSDDIIISHRKYDLLRTLLLINSIKIKEKCNATYYNVVYFYKFRDDNNDLIAKERVFSKLLSELKNEKGNEILLIPIGVDSNVSSVKLILDRYNISDSDLPVVMINEKIKLNDIKNIDDLRTYFNISKDSSKYINSTNLSYNKTIGYYALA